MFHSRSVSWLSGRPGRAMTVQYNHTLTAVALLWWFFTLTKYHWSSRLYFGQHFSWASLAHRLPPASAWGMVVLLPEVPQLAASPLRTSGTRFCRWHMRNLWPPSASEPLPLPSTSSACCLLACLLAFLFPLQLKQHWREKEAACVPTFVILVFV